jgi:hypothetical protein
MRPPRIFQIGFNKCGTRTIHHFFKANGLNCVHWEGGNLARTMIANMINGCPILTGYEEFDVFSDMEFLNDDFAFEAFKLFKPLAEENPGSVFILNSRDREAWIRSRLNHAGGLYARRWKKVMGVTEDAEIAAIWRSDWDYHYARAAAFFADGRNRCIALNLDTDGASVLCDNIPEYKLDPRHFTHRGLTRPAA